LITFGAPARQNNNVLPRLGFAYSPGDSGTTSIRGGFGMAVDVLYDNLGILSLPPQVQQTCDGGPPGSGFPQTGTCFWTNSNFLANGGLPSNQPVPFTNAADARAATSAFIPNQQLPYSETWNLGIQHVFAQKYTLDVRYVGTRGIHLPVQDRINRQATNSVSEYLPTYLTAPSQATLNTLTNTLTSINNNSSFVPAYAANGFNGSNITAYEPYGGSNYNGLQTQFSRNFTNGLQFQAAWTWSHAFDNSTADVFSTVLTPRRPQNFQCLACDWSTSALDRRHRITIEAIYDLPFYKSSSNWAMKNVVGNWQFAPIYTFETPEYATVQSHVDANGDGDPWGDRAILNPGGIPGTGSAVTPLTNSAGETVAYLATNPSAQYIAAGPGALANIARNTLALPRTNNWDMSLTKRINITERQAIEFHAQAINVFNHPQFVPGFISDVIPANTAITTGGATLNVLIPGNASFNVPKNAFSSHPRGMTLVLKYIF
jgi:hypothetical protein